MDLDVPDAYPQDDSELDAMHPDQPIEEQTADWARQRDYEDLVGRIRAIGAEDDILEVLFRALSDGNFSEDEYPDACALMQYAQRHGWKQAVRVAWDALPGGVLPSQGA